MIEIKGLTEFSTHPHGPHFVRENDSYSRVTNEGQRHTELSPAKVIAYLEIGPTDPLRLEAMMLLVNNSGFQFQPHAWASGERAFSLLFKSHDGCKNLPEGGLREDKDGKQFLSLRTESVAHILGAKQDFPPVKESYPILEAHIVAFLKELGLTPNFDRINHDYGAA